MKRSRFIVGLALIFLLVLGVGYYLRTQTKGSVPTDTRAAGHYATPTLFVHGFGGGYGSEKDMIADLSRHKGFGQVLRYTVAADGALSVEGKWSQKTEHPLIAIVFSDGRPDANALVKILKQLKARYAIKSFNAVGHSAGASAWATWAVMPDKVKQPQLKRLVTIAGPFNGFPGANGGGQLLDLTLKATGVPEQMSARYQQLYTARQNFPTGVAVLNIFGNTGKNSDGRVPVLSARSLKGIVSGRATAYFEREVTNNLAQHSQLHEHNPVVNADLYMFLTTGKPAKK